MESVFRKEGVTTEPLSVAILAGGKSRRMGRDKAFLELAGVPLIEHVLDRVRPVADELMVVIGDRTIDEFASLGCRLVPDVQPGLGTLGGLYTAIAEARFDDVLVVGCDMPLLSTKLIEHLACRPRTYDALAPSIRVDADNGGGEMLQPLHAIYSKNCLPVIKRHIESGRLRVMDIFSELRVERVEESELRRFDPQLRSFLNANTPSELEQACSEREASR